MKKTVAEIVCHGIKGHEALLHNLRRYAKVRRVFKQAGKLWVEYVFRDQSRIVKPF